MAVCYKINKEDLKWCTVNGFIVVGDRKWWSTLSDSAGLFGQRGEVYYKEKLSLLQLPQRAVDTETCGDKLLQAV